MQGDDTIQESSAPAETIASVAESTVSPEMETTTSSESSSSESSGETKESLLDAVLKVTEVTPEKSIQDAAKEAVAPTAQPQPEEDEVKAEEGQTTEEADDDDTVPPEAPAKTRRKIRRLLDERRQLRTEVSELKPDAEIGSQLKNYADTNGLSSQDVVFALDLASMVAREDYEGFYKVISPLVRHAQEVTGVVLPPDLYDMVQQGQMTEQAARQFALTRFQNASHEVKVRNMEQQQATAQVQNVRTDVLRSVADYERKLAANDPDYKAKADAVRRTAQAMLFERGGRINNANEALQITKAAYDEVNARYRRMKPAVRPTAPTPGSSNPQTPAARTAPKSLMEAAMQGLANTSRAR